MPRSKGRGSFRAGRAPCSLAGSVSMTIPGIGFSAQTSSFANHTYEMEQDALGEIGHHGFVVDAESHSITVQGKPIHLTPKEFDLLVHLARHAGKVMTHRILLTAVWGSQSAHQPEYLRVFVGQLRKKLETETGKQYIQTEPWVGYRFIPEWWSGNEE